MLLPGQNRAPQDGGKAAVTGFARRTALRAVPCGAPVFLQTFPLYGKSRSMLKEQQTPASYLFYIDGAALLLFHLSDDGSTRHLFALLQFFQQLFGVPCVHSNE